MQVNTNSQDLAPITLKWDPKNLEIKTRSVERTLEPLVIQVFFLSFSVSFLCSIPTHYLSNLLFWFPYCIHFF